MPVQWVNRPDLDFRGLLRADRRRAGRARRPRAGRCPSGQTSTVARIVTDRRRPGRGRGRPVGDAHPRRRDRRQPRRRALRGADEPAGGRPTSSRRTSSGCPSTRCCPGRPYLLKLGTPHRSPPSIAGPSTRSTSTRSSTPRRRRSSSTRSACATSASTGRSRSTRTPTTATWAASSSSTGSRTTRSAPGMIHFALRRSAEHPLAGASRSTRQRTSQLKGQRPCVVWFTGLSGAGKSTIANLVEKRLHALGRAHRPARRRQRPPRPEQGPRLHRGRPGREHPPRRRGGAT